MKKMKDVKWDKVGLFAGGVLFGTAGLKVLSSDDAKKVYTHTTAAVLRAKKPLWELRRMSRKTPMTFWQTQRSSMKFAQKRRLQQL